MAGEGKQDILLSFAVRFSESKECIYKMNLTRRTGLVFTFDHTGGI